MVEASANVANVLVLVGYTKATVSAGRIIRRSDIFVTASGSGSATLPWQQQKTTKRSELWHRPSPATTQHDELLEKVASVNGTHVFTMGPDVRGLCKLEAVPTFVNDLRPCDATS